MLGCVRHWLSLSAAAALVAAMATTGRRRRTACAGRCRARSAASCRISALGRALLQGHRALSGGKFEMKFFEPGALVPALECFDAVSKGSVEACWTTPGYHTGKYPALAFFTTVPFGPNIGEFLAWKWFGGGNKLRDEIYAKHDLIAFDCFCIGPETSGWFRNEIKSLDEMKGLKMRFFGLGAKVMQKLGVSTQLLAAPTSSRRWSAA